MVLGIQKRRRLRLLSASSCSFGCEGPHLLASGASSCSSGCEAPLTISFGHQNLLVSPCRSWYSVILQSFTKQLLVEPLTNSSSFDLRFSLVLVSVIIWFRFTGSLTSYNTPIALVLVYRFSYVLHHTYRFGNEVLSSCTNSPRD